MCWGGHSTGVVGACAAGGGAVGHGAGGGPGGALVVVVVVLVLVLVVLLVLVGAAGAGGGGGGSVGRMNFGTSFAPRSHLVRLPRSHPPDETYPGKISKVLGSISLRSARALQSAAKKWHRTLLLSAPYHADWTDLMRI